MNFFKLQLQFLDFFFPKTCVLCHKEGSFLCLDCFSKIKIKFGPHCPFCKKRVPDGRICKNCRNKEKSPLNGFINITSYSDKDIRKIIDGFKYDFLKELNSPILALFIKFFKENQEIEFVKNPDDFIIIPIPLFWKRLHWRGFNQVEVLGDPLAQFLHIPFKNDILKRIKNTSPLAKMDDPLNRKKEIEGAFLIKNKNEVKNKKIILLDDVATTLSTLSEAAKLLKDSGAKEIWGLVFAK